MEMFDIEATLRPIALQRPMKISPARSIALAVFVFVSPVAFSQVAAVPEVAELQAKYDEKVKLDVLRPHELAVADLNTKFAAALERSQEAAQKSGKLEEAIAIKTEKEAVQAGNYTPAADDAKTSSALKALRTTYRASLSKLELQRDKKLQPLVDAMGKSLDILAETLTKQGKLEDAMAAKKMRDELLAKPAVAVTKPESEVPSSEPLTSDSFLKKLNGTSWLYDPKDNKPTRTLKFDGTAVLKYEMLGFPSFDIPFTVDETAIKINFMVHNGERFDVVFSSDFKSATLNRPQSGLTFKLKKR